MAMKMKIVSGFALIVFLPVALWGQALSKQDLLDLKKAGVDNAVLIQQIQKDGISFEMNAAMTIELKNLGFSDDILSALLSSKQQTSVTHAAAVQNDSVAALYKAGRFPELADHLKATLKANPSDYKTQALLIMTLLKMKERDAAHAEFRQLADHDQDPAAVPYVKQIKALFDALDRTEETKQQLIAALKDYRVSEAAGIIDRLATSPTQKEILRINLDMYEGKFDQARDRFSKIQFASDSEKEHSAIRDHITQTEREYKSVLSRIDVYLYGPLAPCAFSFPMTAASNFGKQYDDIASLSAKEYLELVNNLAQIAPLSEQAQDLGFHAELLTGRYDELERLGDRLLRLRGNIRIPIFGSNGFFRLVIDSRNRRIYTEVDSHRFEPKYPMEKYYAALVPFDLAFDQVKKLSQRNGIYTKKPYYVLQFEPNGVVPSFAVMNILYGSAGEKAQLTVTKNLGQYVAHVIGNSRMKAELADPSKTIGASSGWLTGLVMIGAMTSSDPSLRTAAVDGLQTTQALQAAEFQAQQAAWESFAARDTFNFIEADAFTGLEQLLGVLN